MIWEIIVFETSNKDKPVEKFIKSLQAVTISKIAHGINLLERWGNQLGMPRSKKLDRDLYELRIRGSEEIRILYMFKGKRIYLLHAFKKKSQKTPKKELELALFRVKSINQGN